MFITSPIYCAIPVPTNHSASKITVVSSNYTRIKTASNASTKVPVAKKETTFNLLANKEKKRFHNQYQLMEGCLKLKSTHYFLPLQIFKQ